VRNARIPAAKTASRPLPTWWVVDLDQTVVTCRNVLLRPIFLRDLSSKGFHELVGCDWLAINKRRRLVETPQ